MEDVPKTAEKDVWLSERLALAFMLFASTKDDQSSIALLALA